jgi:hypothetical protein
MYVYWLQLSLVHTQVPGATVFAVSVKGMLMAVAPPIVLVVLEMPGDAGIVITAPSLRPPLLVPLINVAVAPLMPLPFIWIALALTA